MTVSLHMCNRAGGWTEGIKEWGKNKKEQNILISASPYILAAMAGALFLAV